MPEGPEVRRYADQLAAALDGECLLSLTTRLRKARAWMEAHPGALEGRRIVQIRSRGKNLIGRIAGGCYFYAHLLMWGRWQVFPADSPPESERRERARIVTPGAVAVLYSGPIFEVGQGEPFEEIETLRALGPDSLPYPEEGLFDAAEFRRRLFLPDNRGRTVGAALLDQRIVAGLGNYLRAEVLFVCRIDPWRPVADLTPEELDCLCRTVPGIAAHAYRTGGATAPDDQRARMRDDRALVYQPGREYGTRHYVFRRTNLPCLVCGDTVRQRRQFTHHDDSDEERTRIVYYCPTCQGVAS